MPLARSLSHCSSGNPSQHTANLFTGFQNWRRRRASSSVPTSPMTVNSTSPATNNIDSTSFLTSSGLSRHSNQSHRQPNQRYPHNTTTNEEVAASSLPLNTTITLEHPNTDSSSSNNGGEATSNAMSEPNLQIRLLPNIGMNSRCFMFDIIDRVLTPTTVLQMGRYSERHTMHDRLSFKSKVVSRNHAELWMEEGKKIFIRDVGSSSGTFVNRIRLSASNESSIPMELKDGDIIQLGVDYQGGLEQVFRSVKIRLEINRNTDQSNSFSRHAFQQLRQHLMETQSQGRHSATQSSNDNNDAGVEATTLKGRLRKTIINTDTPINNTSSIQECCICLYAIAPLQALFVAPCSHVFHFKCLRPIVFQNYPGFSCPLCRNYYDLEASVAIEVSEVAEAMLSFNINHPYLTSSNVSDTGDSSSLPILSSSAIMQHTTSSPSSPTRQTNHDGNNTNAQDEDQQQQNEIGRSHVHRRNVDGLLLSSTLVDSSMLDQEGVHNNLPL